MEKVCVRQKKSITEVLWVGVSFRDFRPHGGHSYITQVLGDLGVMDRWVHRRNILVQLTLGFSIPFFVFVINFDYLVRQLSAAE